MAAWRAILWTCPPTNNGCTTHSVPCALARGTTFSLHYTHLSLRLRRKDVQTSHPLAMSSPRSNVTDEASVGLLSPVNGDVAFDDEFGDVRESYSTTQNDCCQPLSLRSTSPDTNDSAPLLPQDTNSHYGSLKPKGRTFLSRIRRDSGTPLPDQRCECHTQVKKKDNKARNKLIIATICVLLFMIGEIIGGALSNSLAIMTDAAHMLSDFASFLISLFAIWMANRPPTKLMSFGWHRMEVLGALVSVVVIWILTGVLVYEAVLRVIHQDYEINADIMLITAAIGVYVNTFMVFVLHQHGHGHGHSHGHSHGHGKKDGDGHGHSHGLSIPIPGFLRRKKRERGDPESGEGHSHKKSSKNINVQAAFVHVIGDLIQSIGVVIAAFIIRFKPEWKLADPICTFLFSILVIISTLTVMRDALRVIMEGTPRGLNYQQVLQDLQNIKGVKLAHSLHMWSLTIDKPALAAHLAMDAEEANFQDVLSEASKMLHQKYGFHHTTLQVEDYKRVMGKCDKCQSILPSTTSASWLFTCFCSSGN